MASSSAGWHESLRADEHPTGSSDRSFGLVFAAAFTVLAGLSLWRGSGAWPWWLCAAAAFLAVALVAPGLLSPLNRAWAWIGRCLYVVVNPLVMALLFYSTVVPTGLLMRLFGKDPLRLHFEPQATSYWIPRPPITGSKPTMKNQY